MKEKIIAVCMVGNIILSLNTNVLTAQAVNKFGSLADIAEACSTQAICETEAEAAMIDIFSEVNPYDVIYDYGEAYDAYVDACDWSLVFDVDYYAETFPVLAVQYHDDEDLLLMHFQTVGVHEGRQGCKDFNVGAYLNNCNASVKKAFGDNYAAYYIYYMLKYDTQKKVNTVTADNKEPVRQQYDMVMTWYQIQELDKVNEYREEVDAEPVEFDSEMAAFANYRGYLNAHDGYRAHDWLTNSRESGDGVAMSIIDKMTADTGYAFAENTHTFSAGKYGLPRRITAPFYYKSKEHYEAMVNTKYSYIGISNLNWGVYTRTYGNYEREIYPGSQFDVYLSSGIDTPMHPAK